MKDTGTTLFVGGPRHGRVVAGTPEKDGELYRVPARANNEHPVDYKAAEVTLTFPDPHHPETPGETYSCFVYVTTDLYPNTPAGAQMLQQALPEATLRHYIMTNGLKTTGGPEAVAAQRIPMFIAWCPDCGVRKDQAHEYGTRKERAVYIANHKTSTGHTAQWEDKER